MKVSDETAVPDLAVAIEKAARQKPLCQHEVSLERYQEYLEGSALTPSQKAEMVEAFWSIICAFVELGFRSHPVQQACGKHGTELDQIANSESTKGEPKNDEQHHETDTPAF